MPAPPPLDTTLQPRQLASTSGRPRSRSLLDPRSNRDETDRRRALDDLWGAHGVAQSLLDAPGRAGRSGNASTSSLASGFGSGNASDSAYGTLDEGEPDSADIDADDDVCFSPATDEGGAWRERVAEGFTARSRRRVQAALGADAWRLRTKSDAGAYWRQVEADGEGDTAQSSPEVAQSGVFTFELAFDADSSFDSLESLDSPPPLPSIMTSLSASTFSSRSSPEPSECGESDSAAARLTIARKRRRLLPASSLGDEAGVSFLSRRHTLPRRGKYREAAPTVTFAVTPSDKRLATPSASSSSTTAQPTVRASLSLPPLTHTAIVLTFLISLASRLSPTPLVTPISPVHLRHASTPSDVFVQSVNAALAPFLVSPASLPSLALGAMNLLLLRQLEHGAAKLRSVEKLGVAAATWAAIVALRTLFGWVFGRVLGWAHPHLFSSRAIHEVGAGLAPLLLALSLLSASTSSSRPFLSSRSIAALALNFAVPISSGGAGLWIGLCAVLVGAVGSLAFLAWSFLAPSSPPPTSRLSESPPARTGRFLSSYLLLLLLPTLALRATSPSAPTAHTSASFAQLYLQHQNLLTVLLMTAPRPGNPDFLLRTIDSWLGAFPEPSPSSLSFNATADIGFVRPAPISDRLRLVVYTHFFDHPQFDHALSHFAASSKAEHYITWQRDPRAAAAANRLDQRLHVARGLEYAASLGGAYVLLTEDDFPLCEDDAELREPGELVPAGETRWGQAWEKLQAALVATNELMPDPPYTSLSSLSSLSSSFLTADPPLGHCGLFLSTGGSGLAIRTPLAARLPALLLGADDPHGDLREAAAARGEVPPQHGGEGADTPDLVIQDCLRGRLPECAVCAPGGGPAALELELALAGMGRRSARLPGGVPGERVGKSGLAGTERLLQRHLGYNASTLPGREYGKEEWACGWRQPFNGEPDILTV
ncbi:hypothetical protein JCM10207_005314 [Rhodosporidiobolus poonsookiae]